MGTNFVTMLIQFWRRQTHRSRHTRRDSSERRRIDFLQRLENGLYSSAWNSRTFEPRNPVRRRPFAEPCRQRGDQSLAIGQSSGIRCERFIAREIVETESARARIPLPVVANSDAHW